MDWTSASAADIVRYCHKLELDRAADQKRMAKELDRVTKEQARQAAVLAKHEEMLRKFSFKLEQANNDIEYLNDYCNNLYQLLDIEKLTQAGAVPGSKTDIKCQKKIITLTNQIHSAEARLAKAKYAKAESERILAES